MRWKRLTVRSRPDEQTEVPMSDLAERIAERLWRNAPLATGGVCGPGQEQWKRVVADLIRTTPGFAEAVQKAAQLEAEVTELRTRLWRVEAMTLPIGPGLQPDTRPGLTSEELERVRAEIAAIARKEQPK